MNLILLKKYIPDNGILYIEKWLKPYSFKIIIKNQRKTRLGDYLIPQKDFPHQITVNNNLSKELCFLVLTHEIAHLIAFDLYGKKIQAHGKEWKNTFSNLIKETLNVYNQELQLILTKFAKNPKGSFYADKDLAFWFLSLDDNYINLSQIQENEKFILNNKTFIRLEKRYSKYICKDFNTGKKYLVNELVPIQKI